MRHEPPKYALHPGVVISRNDGQKHFIGVGALATLYRLRHYEYIVWDKDKHGRSWDDYVHLYPKTDGNYGRPDMPEEFMGHGHKPIVGPRRDLRSEIVDLEFIIQKLAQRYEEIRMDMCHLCMRGMCSEHQSSTDFLAKLRWQMGMDSDTQRRLAELYPEVFPSGSPVDQTRSEELESQTE